MNTQLTLLDTMQICHSRGNKIKKWKSAIQVSGEDIYFCDNDCLMKHAEKV